MGNLINQIHDVNITNLKRISTNGGDVFHVLKKSDPGYNGFGEAYFSSINPGCIKAWKRHNVMTMNLVVISGFVRFVLFDDRDSSDCHGSFQTIELGLPNSYSRLTVPSGIWMGFECIGSEPGLLLNIANIEHDPLEVSRKDIDEISFKWRNL